MTSLSGVTRNRGDPPAKIIQKPNRQSRLNVFWGPGPAELMGPLPPPFPSFPPLPLPSSPLLSPPLPSPPLPLEVGPLNPARGSGGAL